MISKRPTMTTGAAPFSSQLHRATQFRARSDPATNLDPEPGSSSYSIFARLKCQALVIG